MPKEELASFDLGKYYKDHKFFIIGVIEAAQAKDWSYDIKKPCCCDLGKDLSKQMGKAFTQHPSWKEAIEIHKELHIFMESYFHKAKNGATEEELHIERTKADVISFRLMKCFEAVIEFYGAKKNYMNRLKNLPQHQNA